MNTTILIRMSYIVIVIVCLKNLIITMIDL